MGMLNKRQPENDEHRPKRRWNVITIKAIKGFLGSTQEQNSRRGWQQHILAGEGC